MWLITSIGFFSIVQKPDDVNGATLTIRARAKGDLDALRELYLPTLGAISANAGTDYRYRARAPRADIVKTMEALVTNIGYDNFKNEVQKQQGKARAQTYHRVWDALYGIKELEESKQPDRSSANAPRLKHAFGGVLIDEQGRILLRKPRGEFDGYVWTFAKGRPEPGETSEQTALREVREETGYDAEITGRLPGSYVGGTTVTAFFIMSPNRPRQAFGQETEEIQWVAMDEAGSFISQTRNPKGRERDLNILRDVAEFFQSRVKIS